MLLSIATVCCIRELRCVRSGVQFSTGYCDGCGEMRSETGDRTDTAAGIDPSLGPVSWSLPLENTEHSHRFRGSTKQTFQWQSWHSKTEQLILATISRHSWLLIRTAISTFAIIKSLKKSIIITMNIVMFKWDDEKRFYFWTVVKILFVFNLFYNCCLIRILNVTSRERSCWRNRETYLIWERARKNVYFSFWHNREATRPSYFILFPPLCLVPRIVLVAGKAVAKATLLEDLQEMSECGMKQDEGDEVLIQAARGSSGTGRSSNQLGPQSLLLHQHLLNSEHCFPRPTLR